MSLMKNLNHYLQKRGQRWHYVRRVPREYQAFDKHGMIRKALKTESLELARKRRDELVVADDQYWDDIARLGSVESTSENDQRAQQRAWHRYEQAKYTAMAYGFAYKSIDELVGVNTAEILARLEAIEARSGLGNLPTKNMPMLCLERCNAQR